MSNIKLTREQKRAIALLTKQLRKAKPRWSEKRCEKLARWLLSL